MTRPQVAKIVRYDAAHEIGLVRCVDDSYWVVEGPITTDGPYRWVKEANSFSGASVQFDEAVARVRL